jgi:hypothetical protein
MLGGFQMVRRIILRVSTVVIMLVDMFHLFCFPRIDKHENLYFLFYCHKGYRVAVMHCCN